jgi:hypothetical protein
MASHLEASNYKSATEKKFKCVFVLTGSVIRLRIFIKVHVTASKLISGFFHSSVVLFRAGRVDSKVMKGEVLRAKYLTCIPLKIWRSKGKGEELF